MLVTPNDIRTKRFNGTEGLVDSVEVVEFLHTVARQVDDLLAENAFLKESIFRADKHNEELRKTLGALQEANSTLAQSKKIEIATWRFILDIMNIKAQTKDI